MYAEVSIYHERYIDLFDCICVSSASAIALAFLTTDTAVSLLKVKVGMITFMLTEIDQGTYCETLLLMITYLNNKYCRFYFLLIN